MANPAHHLDIEQVVGDDWTIVGALTDTNGGPLDLTNAALEWTLIAPDGTLAIPNNSATIVMVAPLISGTININVPRDVTATLLPGRYIDALRVTISDLKDTIWVGTILVDADLFSIQDLTVIPTGIPSQLTNGAFWTDGVNVFVRLNGVTFQLLLAG